MISLFKIDKRRFIKGDLKMKKILLIVTGVLLFLMAPSDSYVSAGSLPSRDFVENEDSYTFEMEGKMHTLTLVTENGVRTAYLENEDGIETTSYDEKKHELRINDEVVEEEYLEELTEVANELSMQESEDLSISTIAAKPLNPKNYNWKHVKTYSGEFNVKIFTAITVIGIILLLPTGTGAIAGAVFTAKAIAVVANGIVAASGSNKKHYYTVKTYYSPRNGYYNNKFVLSVYKDKKKKKLIKSVSHITRYGKKY